MRVAVKVGYVGEGFFGYQRQPGRRTVEGCILQALEEAGLIGDERGSRFASAGRTDRGVNALGQVIAFDPEGSPKAICERMNSRLPREIFALGWAAVPAGFNPRTHARMRTYLYLLNERLPLSALRSSSRVFEGEHDFSQFSRPSERRTIRSVERIRVEGGQPTRLYFTAKGFLWTQVRRMVSAIRLMALGELKVDEVVGALGGVCRLALPPAPAENLILWRIEYDGLVFRPSPAGSRRAKEFLDLSARRLEAGLSARRILMAGLADDAPVA